jgi:hypothetical protein
MITTLVTDIVLLLIMLIGLLRLGFHRDEYGIFGLGHHMWRQVGCLHFLPIVVLPVTFLFTDTHTVLKGLIWLFLSIIAEVPPVVSGINSMYLFLPFIVVTLLPSQVFISLNLNGMLPFSPVY